MPKRQDYRKLFNNHPMKKIVKSEIRSGKRIHCPYGEESLTNRDLTIEHFIMS